MNTASGNDAPGSTPQQTALDARATTTDVSESITATLTIAAVIPAFNRKALLRPCIAALLGQSRPPEAIIIIDNASIDGTEAMLRDEGYLADPRIQYKRLPTNTGSAGGFAEGVKTAAEAGYDWIWLIDDDGIPAANALEKLVAWCAANDVAAVAPAVHVGGTICEIHRGMAKSRPTFFRFHDPLPGAEYRHATVDVDFASYLGLLVRRRAVLAAGYPLANFFFRADDLEWSFRLREQGRILLIPASIVRHEEAQQDPYKKRRRRDRRIAFEKLWLGYFELRNVTWMSRFRLPTAWRFYAGAITFYLRKVVGILIYDDHKWRRIRFITAAMLDGYRGDFDNSKPKRLLYE